MENPTSLRPRQVYSLTAEGEANLRRHLALPIEERDVIWDMDILMLRFAFMGEVLGRKRTLVFLRELAHCIERYLDELNRIRETMIDDREPYGRLALESGIAGYEATATWARSAIKQLILLSSRAFG